MRTDIAEDEGAAMPEGPDEQGCAYMIDAADGQRPRSFCGAACTPGSAYCPEHHARCHLRGGSAAERRRLREIEAFGAAAGGKRVRDACEPSALMLQRLERAARSAFARQECSCFVPVRDSDAAD
jgi:hypothetical protein